MLHRHFGRGRGSIRLELRGSEVIGDGLRQDEDGAEDTKCARLQARRREERPEVVLWIPKQVLPASVGCFQNPNGTGLICH